MALLYVKIVNFYCVIKINILDYYNEVVNVLILQ